MIAVDGSLSLATFRASRAQRTLAICVALATLAVAIVVLPFARLPAPVVAPFLPAFVTAVSLTDAITAFLLFRQAIVGRSTAVAVLASAYLYSALIVIPHLLAFPGVFSPTGLFGAGSQTAVWLWGIWHLGWPALVLVSISLMRAEERARRAPPRQVLRRQSAGFAAGTFVVVGFIAFVTFRLQAHLPVLVVRGDYHPLIAIGLGPLIVIAAVGALAAALAVLRLRAAAHVWLTVALVACSCDVVITLMGGTRYSIGWYAARFDSILTASVVLFALLYQAGRLSGILADNERRLRSIVDGVADALLTVTRDGAVASANPAAEMLFGFPPGRLEGMQIEDLVVDYVARVKLFRGSTAIEALGRQANGRTFPIELAFGGETEGGRIVIARDITQRRRAEDAIRDARDRALEAATVKSTFLATMSHEIRTPINAIVGMSELLLQTQIDADAREYATTVHDSAGALLAIINDILDFSKIDAGKLEIDAIPFSVLAVAETASDIIAALARAKGLSLSSYIAPDVPAAALGDPDRLRQILLNLLGNAVKFTDHGSVSLRATVDETIGLDRTVVRFEVSDTGPGISSATIAAIFEPFRQADSSTRRKHGGTGLGLSISKRLVELMGGAIGARSTVGSGSTFWFTVPLRRVDDAPVAHSESPLRGRRVLIVEPEPVARQVMAQYLLGWGAIATPLSSVSSGLDTLRAAAVRGMAYDVALIGDEPNADNHAVWAVLLASDEPLAQTPVIMVTGSDEPGAAADAAARGIRGFLRKPVHQSALYDALMSALGMPEMPLATPPARTATATAAPKWNGTPPLILVAEDNVVNRKLAERQLRHLGVRCELVGDGREAVAAVARRSYDLVLMDCQMPEMDGFEATRMIRAAEAPGVRLPIIALTANALEGDRDACLAAGMDDYLAKPVQLAELRAALERHAGGKPVAR